jgi:hypothetical protein
MIDWSYWLLEIGAWLIAFGITFGAIAGLLWCMAKFLEDRR